MEKEEKEFLKKIIKKHGCLAVFEEINNQAESPKIRDMMEDIIEYCKDEFEEDKKESKTTFKIIH